LSCIVDQRLGYAGPQASHWLNPALGGGGGGGVGGDIEEEEGYGEKDSQCPKKT